ncbi:MAG: hypothetical protein DI539_16180 [Flavobacterium psychrophilum]|nr:MAG: hypothetical protein DI539_16180 [Flavobacterium psychrophilum]
MVLQMGSSLNIFNLCFDKCRKLHCLMLLVFFIFTAPVYSQMQDFELQVTTTDETCNGNGTMTFIINNGTPGSTMSYTVYKLPDETNPISVSSSNTLGSLSEGDYKIIAVQSIGQESNKQEVHTTIIKTPAPFDFEVSATNQACVEGANMIITVTEGTGAFYEIISGPVERPVQESNVFEGLPAGIYVVRVFNECGDAEVTTYTLAASPGPPAISAPSFEASVNGDCDTVTVTNTISYGEGIAITYPITIEYTITPGNGNPPTTIVQTYESGDAIALSITQTFPVDEADYSYSMKITDACNSQYQSGDMSLNPERSVSHIANIILPCGQHYLTLNVQNFVPPFTINFTESPEGFEPSVLNDTHPGPFDANGTVVYGDQETAVPEGKYVVEVVDHCGNTISYEFEIDDEIVEAVAGGSNNGCFSEFGRIAVSVPNRKIVSASIIEAPPAYEASNPLPKDVTANINSNGTVILVDMPKGEYKFIVTDECGKEHEVTALIPDFEEKGFTGSSAVSCVVGSGALRVTSGNGKLTSLTMTAAPVEFDQDLPLDVTSYIDATGVFFMENLPPGNYSFSGVDICGIEVTASVSISAGGTSGNAVTYTRNCGNFDLGLMDSGSNTFGDPPTYWLQKLIDAANDTWGHPVTGITFAEGTEPNANNSLSLVNGQTLVALEYEGTLRVVRYFENYVSPQNIKSCFGQLATFEYSDGVKVKSVYNISCYQNSNDIYVDATGLAPLHYSIISKDDAPFPMDNGNNSIFSGLVPGKYEFLVEDACGFVGTIEVDIRQLPELTNAHDPGDMLFCVEAATSSTEFDLETQTPLILENQPAALYTVTYHLSEQDAEGGVNAIPTLHTNTSNPQTIYARLVHRHISLCHDVVSFNLRISEYPVIKMKRDYILCTEDNQIVLHADSGFNNYQWSTGATTSSIVVKKAGDYWVKVGNEYDGFICETTADITVTASGPAEAWSVEIQDWTDNQNSIRINVTEGQGNYEYSLDDDFYQDEPIFTHLQPGIYTVYIRDKNGCGMVSEKLALLNYPKFFTPNGDGINEKWRLEYSWFEPEARIFIYDRYGKLITGFTPQQEGWDGMLNGKPLPSTDYWFVVYRKDGRIHRGHFSMIR